MDYGDVSIDFEAPSGQWGMKYDLDYRLAQQYARTLHPAWWNLFVAADKHTRDIDVHHQPHYPGLHFVKGGVWCIRRTVSRVTRTRTATTTISRKISRSASAARPLFTTLPATGSRTTPAWRSPSESC